MSPPTWHLVDAESLARAHKYTFYKPSSENLAKISPGENVKLIFGFTSDEAGAPEAERMWVIVDTIEPGGKFTGRLDNDPNWIQDLKAGDPLTFEECHIINTEHSEPGNLIERYSKRCFVTQRVLQEGRRVGYLYREEADDGEDSGWRLMANDESHDYMNIKGNVQYVSVGRVLSCDEGILPLLDSGVGSAFLLDQESNTYVAAERDA